MYRSNTVMPEHPVDFLYLGYIAKEFASSRKLSDCTSIEIFNFLRERAKIDGLLPRPAEELCELPEKMLSEIFATKNRNDVYRQYSHFILCETKNQASWLWDEYNKLGTDNVCHVSVPIIFIDVSREPPFRPWVPKWRRDINK